MKALKKVQLMLVLWVLAQAASVSAQTVLNLPRPSQAASVSQRVGITDISIEYSRPLVKGRKIWGGVVPYDQVWRAGANENTTINFSDPVTIENQSLPAGSYGLHMIPHDKNFTIIFSKTSTAWGSFTYDAGEDALRVTAKTSPADFREALSYEFDELQPDSVVVSLRWERLAVSFRVAVDTRSVVSQNLEQQLRAWPRWMWQSWDEAATYLLECHGDLQVALSYADHSIQVEERFDNLLTKSQILNAMGHQDEAQQTRQKALSLASSQQLHNYGMSLIGAGRRDEAFEIFRINTQKHPDTLITHIELARLASARGDFKAAIEEVNAALKLATDLTRRNLENLRRRLENNEDINK